MLRSKRVGKRGSSSFSKSDGEGSCVIRETTQTGCPWSRLRVSLSLFLSIYLAVAENYNSVIRKKNLAYLPLAAPRLAMPACMSRQTVI